MSVPHFALQPGPTSSFAGHRLASQNLRLLTSPFSLKEHVLRDVSNGSDPTFRRSRPHSSSITTNPYDEPPADNPTFDSKPRSRSGRHSKYSPTPSIKRGKAEKFLKEHGSPPGIRVTAGGRIVPHGRSPVPSPRFFQHPPSKYQAFNRLNRTIAYPVPAQLGMRSLNGCVVDLGNGNFVQVIDGQPRPVEQRDGTLHLYMPAPNLTLPPISPNFCQFEDVPMYSAFSPVPIPVAPYANAVTQPSMDHPVISYNPAVLGRELRVMESVHEKLEQELKDLDRSEVLQRDSLSSTNKADIVRRRIELVNRIDESRRGIVEAKRLMNERPSGTISRTQAPDPSNPGVHGLPQPHFHAFGSADPYYNMGMQQVPGGSELDNCNAPAYHAPMQDFPLVAQGFHIPAGASHHETQSQVNVYQQAPQVDMPDSTSLALQGRSGNVNVGHGTASSHGNRDSAETAKTFYPPNLDGSAHQPRRSHAIEIKVPKDIFEKANVKSLLNPTSPSYEPGRELNATSPANDDDRSVFVPSPTLVAQMDNLVQSPRMPHDIVDDQGPGQQGSDDSATTGDFFPMDAKQHSSTRYSWSARDHRVNLPAWMAKEPSDAKVMSMHVVTDTSKYLWAADEDNIDETTPHMLEGRTPSMCTISGQLPSNGSPSHRDFPCDLEFITQSAFTHISPATKRQQSTHLRESTATVEELGMAVKSVHHDPVSELLQKASQQVAGLTPATIGADYYEGYQTGLRQAIIGDKISNQYRQGYRDGIVASSRATVAPAVSSAPALSTNVHHSNRQTLHTQPSPIRDGPYSDPSRPMTIRPYTLPTVPQNSVSTTPMTARSSKERSPAATLSLDSPQAHADFMSRPNVNVSIKLTPGRAAGTQHSSSSNSDPYVEPTSPLAHRQTPKAIADITASRVYSGIAQSRNLPLDQQRFQKAKPSTAQSNDFARGHLPGQLDGSEEDEKRRNMLVENSPSSMGPMSPPMSPKSKGRSPVKAAATAAVASITHFARPGTKKEQEPMKSPSPEKRVWRSKWMGGRRGDEGEDNDTFKKKFVAT